MWVGIGWDGMDGYPSHRSSKSTLGANKFHKCIRMYDFDSLLVSNDESNFGEKN